MMFRTLSRLLVAAVTLSALSCTSYPDSYPPPIQRGPSNGAGSAGFRHFVAMSDPGAEACFVQDISPALEANSWRWTGQRPTLRFVLEEVEELKFTMDFSVPGVTFKETGPATISFFVNGNLLDKVRYNSYGEKHFEKAVDSSWLEAGVDTVVVAEIDPVWVSPKDGTKLGIILVQAGFVK